MDDGRGRQIRHLVTLVYEENIEVNITEINNGN
jgi:hypothetical protein